VYQPTAEKKMRQIALKIWEHWPVVQGIAGAKRTGTLQPRFVMKIIVCASAHRDTEVFDATHYGIDLLKEIEPVWKKEVGPSGEELYNGYYILKSGEKIALFSF
jgi:molybdopterin synthase catalytic subunit